MEETKTILVTGGSRGIGKEVALKYAENGYNVVINYVSDKTDVEAIKNELLEKGAHDVLLAKADVTNAEQIEELVKQAIEKFGAIDVLVNNAGITKDRTHHRNAHKSHIGKKEHQLISILIGANTQ